VKNYEASKPFVVLKWLTRVVGSLLMLFMVFMLLSYVFGPERSIPGAPMFLTIALMAIGVGMAWKWEGSGGLVILAGTILLFVFHPRLIWSPGPYHIMLIVAISFLICWFNRRNPHKGTQKYI